MAKIALPSYGDNLKSAVNPAFGRAKNFILVDSDTREFNVIENPAAQVPGGAGVRAAQLVADSGAQVLITFQCGQKAAKVLKAARVQIYEAVSGSIAEVVDEFAQGQLRELKAIHPGYHGGR